MKSNHIPVEERLYSRICKLQYKLDAGIISTKDRFYHYCKYCEMDVISISIRNGKHRHNCELDGIDKQIDYYKMLLKLAKES